MSDRNKKEIKKSLVKIIFLTLFLVELIWIVSATDVGGSMNITSPGVSVVNAINSSSTISWQKCLGGSGSEEEHSIHQTSDGGYIVTGGTDSYDGDVTGNHGHGDYWVVKLDANSTIQWQKCLGGSNTEKALDVQQISDGGYILTGFASSIDGDVTGNHGGDDYWVVNLTNAGDISWQKCLGGAQHDDSISIQQTNDGGYIVCGISYSVDGNVTGNHGNGDYWVVKLNNEGNISWEKCLGGSAYDYGLWIRQTIDNGYIVSGNTYSNDGNVSGNHGGQDIWVVKLNDVGNISWEKCLGGSAYDFGYPINQTTDGGYILTGWTNSTDGNVSGNHGGLDIWVVKLNEVGNISWQKCLGGSGDDQGQNIKQITNGGYILTGFTGSTDGNVTGNHGQDDLWVVNLTKDGDILSQKCLGGSYLEYGGFVDNTSDGGYIVGGTTDSDDGDVSGNHYNQYGPSSDFWVVKLIEGESSPVANFTANITVGPIPLSIQFTDTSSGTPTSWQWVFGDGNNSTVQHPIHTYSAAGLYTVNLTVNNSVGSDTKVASNYINATNPVIAPVANFTANRTSGNVPLGVQFTDLSTENPISWSWSFGDGGSSTGQNPKYVYSTAGIYTVNLTVTNSAGLDTKSEPDYINATKEILKPVASFTGSPRSGSIPLSVQFTDQSTNIPTTWFWTFGNGANSTVQNPAHTYSTAGVYTVNLTVTNSAGSDTKAEPDYINATKEILKPVASFTGSPRSGSVPLSVQFTDQSTNIPITWFWIFGDGDNSTVQNPAHSYSTAGIYTVNLTVTNSAGSDTKTESDYINATKEILKPVASFTGSPRNGSIPLSVQFTDQSTNIPSTWLWTFGDGENSTVQNPAHTYTTAGLYTVNLTAINSAGSDTKTEPDYINATREILKPVASFTGTPRSGSIPLSVQFTDQSTNIPSTWLWNFGDSDSSTVQNPAHTYSAAGVYTVNLTATNSAGSDTKTESDYINATKEILKPVASFTGSPRNGSIPLSVQFTDQSTNIPTIWFWTFGDGENSTVQNPAHTYTTAGLYTVNLTAINSAGSDTKTEPDYINATREILKPVASFTGTPRSGSIPLSVQFTDQSTNIPSTWLWNFGDSDSSTVQNPAHTYSAAGVYTVNLTATNSAGSDTKTESDYINATKEILKPVASFTGSPRNGSIPLSVQFTDQSTNIPTIWFWTFGDGDNSTVQNPAHTYSAAGVYAVNLTATNSAGSDTKTEPDYINATKEILKPVASFTGSPRSGSIPLSVQFTDQSTNIPTTWFWTFDDGDNSTVQNPAHTYSTAGIYTVNLTVSNSAGSDTKTESDYINAISGTHIINATADSHTIVYPAGVTTYSEGANKTYLTQSKPGSDLTDVLVDADSKGSVKSWTFTNIVSDHNISTYGSYTIGQVQVFFSINPTWG